MLHKYCNGIFLLVKSENMCIMEQNGAKENRQMAIVTFYRGHPNPPKTTQGAHLGANAIITCNGKLLLENKLSKESFRAILYDGNVNIRFKIVDEFLKLKNRLW